MLCNRPLPLIKCGRRHTQNNCPDHRSTRYVKTALRKLVIIDVHHVTENGKRQNGIDIGNYNNMLEYMDLEMLATLATLSKLGMMRGALRSS